MRVLAWSILVVAVTTALLVWGGFRLIRDVEKMQRDPKLLRRAFLRMAIMYIAGSVFGIIQVATGSLPPIALMGIPVAGALAWTLIKQASNVKIPPS